MEAGAHLLQCGCDSFKLSPLSINKSKTTSPLSTFPSFARFKSRRSRVVAVATEPKSVPTRFENVSEEIKRVRKQMEEDEQLASLMRGLRGQNLRDSQFADENIRLRLVEVDGVNTSEALPLVYDPDIISAYWGKRPRAVATPIVELLSVACGFLSHSFSSLI